jgi:hypothetical protein
MKAWIKGGLVGGGIGIMFLLIPERDAGAMILSLFLLPLYLLFNEVFRLSPNNVNLAARGTGFIISVILGFLIGYYYDRKKENAFVQIKKRIPIFFIIQIVFCIITIISFLVLLISRLKWIMILFPVFFINIILSWIANLRLGKEYPFVNLVYKISLYIFIISIIILIGFFLLIIALYGAG